MTRTAMTLLTLGLILLLCQVVVFNNVCLFGVAVPIVFILVLIKLPITLSVHWVMTVCFLTGLIDDVFADTYGMNALACTILGFVRQPVLRLYVTREEDLSNPVPSCHSLGRETFAKFLLTMTLLYCFLIFLIEAFSFFNIKMLLIRIICSTLLSFVIMYAIDSVMSTPRREKRL